VALVNSPFFPQVASSLSFYYAAAFAAGLFLAWRFNSSRILFSLLTLCWPIAPSISFRRARSQRPGHMAVTWLRF